ncbi:hypothetical protein N9L18_00110 [Candidatus Pacebacteria bacterium]|nr:hypothetical protein [Candidatus Paceibacterota bacterium]
MKYSSRALFLSFVFIIFGVFLAGTSVLAQTSLPPGYKEELIIKRTPSVPTPGETVEIKIESLSTDLKRATVTWTLNGIVQKQGSGEVNYSFVAPNAGQQATVRINVLKEDGKQLNEEFILAPADIDLIYESETYTPPFYKGRSIYSHQSDVKIVAVPNLVSGGIKSGPENIIYTWEKDGVVLQDLSGLGEDTIVFPGRILSRPFSVTVTAEVTNSNIKAKSSIVITPFNPKLIVYESGPLQGNRFDKPIVSTKDFEGEELWLTAVPYFFSVNEKDSVLLDYTWLENDKLFSDQSAASRVILENIERASSGRGAITVGVSHVDNILQSGRIDFGINVIGLSSINSQINDETTAF